MANQCRLIVAKPDIRYTTYMTERYRFMGILLLAMLLHGVLLWKWDIQLKTRSADKTIVATLQPTEKSVSSESTAGSSSAITFAKAIDPSVPKESSHVAPLRKRSISAASHEKKDRDYLMRWQNAIEQFGNQHYPAKALENNIRGQLRLLVAINKDGSLHEVSIRKSSGSALLDQAAINIVKMAAPFEPIPSELSQDIEILEIIRTWQFQGTRLAAANDR